MSFLNSMLLLYGSQHNNRFRICYTKLTLIRQNGAPSGLEKRGLDASIYHKTRKPTEGTQ
ncbi:hypothetical protein [Leptospira interrogans]|uniref:hypothetical protein n=1 Tax=Leptospira interrogans TaxID=173 RepID=UPI00201679DB|nr:hypothetical protein [Leptospira interrogans]